MSNHSPLPRANCWRVVLIASVFAALTGCAGSLPQELRGPGPQKGQTVHTETKIRFNHGQIVVRAGRQRTEGTCEFSMTTVEDTELLEVDGRQVTKLQSTISTDENSHAMQIEDKKDSGTDRGPLMGEKILRERVDGKWKNTLVGKEPTAKQKRELEFLAPLENEDELFPEGKVKPGHTWKADAARLRKFFGSRFTALSGDSSMTFERTANLNGEYCALIILTLNLKGKVLDEKNNELNFELTAKGPTYRSLTSGYDVNSWLSGSMKLTGTVTSGGQRVQAEMVGPVTVESLVTVK